MDFRPTSLARHSAAALTCLLLVSYAWGDAYDPPANYYSTATGTGATLKSQLHNIIDDHTVISYSATTSALAVTDVDPNNSNNLLTVYDRTSINKQYSSNPLIWNREHTWPRSRGVLSSGPDDSDLFNLRPSLAEGNGDRANWNFGGTYGVTPMGVIVQAGDDMWYPGDADAGMIARQEFYMAVRYDGSDANTTNLELATGNPAASTGTLGDLNRLMEWHFAAPPDAFERRRNQVIYDQYQHNRDPFIDRPELAWSIFVDQANDTSLGWSGGVAGTGGETTLNVDLGRRLVGSSLPAGQTVTLNKAGVDGTYYSVTATGAATSTVTGRYNAFTMGASGSKSMVLGLAPGTSTATAGLRSGTVTVDNLDVTTGGGAGKGANDGNDVATVSLAVLDHANPTFSGIDDLNTLNFDFGTIALGAAPPTFAFSVFNLSATAGFTAGLDLDAIAGSGDTAALTTNIATFGGAAPLAAGASHEYSATLATSTVGAFAATYSLNFSDENLVGATGLGTLTLNLSGIVSAPVPETADFDGDGDVDGQDFLAWQKGLGLSSGAAHDDGDANGDLRVDAADLQVWREQFASTPALIATPEPRASILLPLAAALLAAVRRPACYS